MTDALLGLLIGLQAGWYARRMYLYMQQLLRREDKKEAFVTNTNPAATREHLIGDSPSIITPKSPQRLEWEEAEELRKMNLTPR